MGDILAHRVVQSGGGLMHWHIETIRNLSQTLVEYLTEERLFWQNPSICIVLSVKMNTLQDQAANLEKRVNALIVK